MKHKDTKAQSYEVNIFWKKDNSLSLCVFVFS